VHLTAYTITNGASPQPLLLGQGQTVTALGWAVHQTGGDGAPEAAPHPLLRLL